MSLRRASTLHPALRGLAVAGVAVTMTASLTTTASAKTPPAPKPPAKADQVVAPVPKITWQKCPPSWGSTAIVDENPSLGITFDCATAKVPMDYDKPKGKTIDLALRRVPAKQQHNKIGTLFVNPGGPGGSGVDFMSSGWSLFSPWVRDKFDIVGFDPRGIARSEPLVCFSSMQEMREITGAVDPLFPATHKEFLASAKAADQTIAACKRNAGEIINHMSTANVVRDMDLLRQAVGDEKLTFNGISYGTQIGQTYAAMYPNRVRAMVIDAVVDPVKWSMPNKTQGAFIKLDSDIGTWETYKQFTALCAKAGPQACPLNLLGKPEVVVDKLAASLRKEPVRVDFGEGMIMEINYQALVGALTGNMYSPSGWKDLSAALTIIAVEAGVVPPARAAQVKAAAPKASARAAMSGQPMPQSIEGIAPACLDSLHPQSHAVNFKTGLWSSKTRSGYFGQMRAWQTDFCAGLPGKDTDRYTGPYKVKTSNPVLVVGVKHDPATVYAGAVAARKNLSNSRLLTYDGWGHPAIGQNVCTDNAISNYLLAGTLPKDGQVCSPVGSPFDTPATLAGMGNVSKATKQARIEAQKTLARIELGATR